MSDYTNTIGQTVEEMRKTRYWSRRELSERSGIGESAIFRAERGVSEPCTKTLESIFTAFGPLALKVWNDDPDFYKVPAQGLAWPDRHEPVPSWLRWLEEEWDGGNSDEAT